MKKFSCVLSFILLISCSKEEDLGGGIIYEYIRPHGIYNERYKIYLHIPDSVYVNDQYVFGISDGSVFSLEEGYNEFDSNLCRFFTIDIKTKNLTFEFISEEEYNTSYEKLKSTAREVRPVVGRLMCDLNNRKGKAAPSKFIT